MAHPSKPSAGQTNWDVALNSALDVAYDRAAAYAIPLVGSTAKGDLLVNNGSAWTRIPVGTNTQVLTADSAQTLGIKWAAAAGGGGGGTSTSTVVSVKDATYGAVGNDSTDDTTAIQNAINAAAASGGGVVYFPEGTYKISSALTLLLGVSLVGDNPLSSIIHQSSTSANGVTLNNVGAAYTQISNLGFTGPGSGTGIGLNMNVTTATDNQIGMDLHNLIIKNFGSHGLWIQGAIASTIQRVHSKGHGGDGFRVEKLTTNKGTTSTTFLNCYAASCTGNGYYVDDNTISGYMSFMSCAADSVAIGYSLNNITNVALNACGTEVTTTAGFKLNGANNVTLTSCLSTGSSGKDYWFTGTSVDIAMIGTYAATAGAGHTAGVQVDASAKVMMINHTNTASVISAGGTIITGKAIQLSGDNATGLTFGSDTNLYRGAADILQTDDNFAIKTIGKGLQIAFSNSAGKCGEATLASGTVTVSNTSVKTGSRIILWRHGANASTALGELNYSSIVDSTSFVITSLNPTTVATQTGDASTVGYLIIDPA